MRISSPRTLLTAMGVTVLFCVPVAVPATASAATYASTAPATSHSPAAIVALPYMSQGWQHMQVASPTAYPDFYLPSFDASSWPVGQEGFGTTNGSCSWNNSEFVKTYWHVFTDMLVRHSLSIPKNAMDVVIRGSIDNDATVYLNGVKLQYVQSGGCQSGAIDARVPSHLLGTDNLLAIRGHDYGVATYLNVQVTYQLCRGKGADS